MGNEIVRTDINLDDLQRTARLLAASNYFDAKGGDALAIAQIATKILAGRELGYGPFASVQGIHVIQGRPALSANIMAAAVKNSPRYDYRVRKMDATECVIEFFERCDGKRESLGVSTFTMEDAKRAEVKNLNKFPRNMLFARAMSNGVRWFCPDVFSGNTVYTPDELGADVDDSGVIVVDGSTGEIVEERKAPAQPQHRQQPVTVAPATNGNGHKPSVESLDDVQESPVGADVAANADEATELHKQAMSRFHAAGTSTFGPSWEDVRHSISTTMQLQSSSQFTAPQLNALADSFKTKSRQWQTWQRAMSNGTLPPVELAFGTKEVA